MSVSRSSGTRHAAGEWASARLRVADERIVGADVPGLAREVDGLTLLEAAAIDGEPLAVEALASALGQVFRAAPEPGRVAVAMSGGVDSAVALLRAGPRGARRDAAALAGPGRRRTRSGVLLAGRGRCRARDLPRTRLPARDARPARGLQAAIVDPFTAAYEAGETPNPCMRCNGAFRFDELVAFAERAGAARALDGPLRTDR